MRKYYLLLLFMSFTLFSTTNLQAQNIGINASGATPDASAGLDVDFTNKGVLVPRIALTAANVAAPVASPTASLLVYNTATAGASPNNVTPGYYYWNGVRWVSLSTDPTAWRITGNAGTLPATNFLGTTDNQSLVFRTNNTERMRVLNNGNVGIGTTTPAYKFHIQNVGNIGATPLSASNNSGTDGVALQGYNSGASNLYNAIEGGIDYSGTGIPAGVKGMALSTNSNGVGVSAHSNNTTSSRMGYGVYASTSNSLYNWAGYFIGDVYSTTGFYSPSDQRLKKDIVSINSSTALQKIMQMKSYSYVYDWKKINPNAAEDLSTHYGFMAQELKEVIPEAVKKSSISIPDAHQELNTPTKDVKVEDVYAVNYDVLIPVLVEAMKEQQTMIERQQTANDSLRDEVNKLKDELQMLKLRINK